MAVDTPHRPVALLDLSVGDPAVDARKRFSDCNLVDLSCVQKLIASHPVVVFSKFYWWVIAVRLAVLDLQH